MINGIRYTLMPDQTMSVKANKRKELKIVEIPSTVRIDTLGYAGTK